MMVANVFVSIQSRYHMCEAGRSAVPVKLAGFQAKQRKYPTFTKVIGVVVPSISHTTALIPSSRSDDSSALLFCPWFSMALNKAFVCVATDAYNGRCEKKRTKIQAWFRVSETNIKSHTTLKY